MANEQELALARAMQINDGGPAFPHLRSECQRVNETEMYEGLTMRDYFAAHATEEDIAEFMPATMGEVAIFEQQHGYRMTRWLAKYKAADAMLAARKEAHDASI
jgi:hypothetical protein